MRQVLLSPWCSRGSLPRTQQQVSESCASSSSSSFALLCVLQSSCPSCSILLHHFIPLVLHCQHTRQLQPLCQASGDVLQPKSWVTTRKTLPIIPCPMPRGRHLLCNCDDQPLNSDTAFANVHWSQSIECQGYYKLPYADASSHQCSLDAGI